MKNILILIFSFISLNSYTQIKKIYVDENYKEIDFIKYRGKLKSNLFVIATVKSDTAIFKKLRFKEFFGDLGRKKKSQLNRLFNSRFKIDTTKVWLIHYQDSLPNIKLMPKESKIVYLDSAKRIHKHIISYEDDKKIIPKELKTFRKIKTMELLHFYETNNGYPEKTKDYKWLQDYNSILKRTFSDGMLMYRQLIIFPNGEFYVYSGRKTFPEIKKLLKYKSFLKIKKRFRKKYNKIKNVVNYIPR